MTTSRNQREGHYIGRADRVTRDDYELATGHVRISTPGKWPVDAQLVWSVLHDRQMRRIGRPHVILRKEVWLDRFNRVRRSALC